MNDHILPEHQSELAYCQQQYNTAVENEQHDLAEYWANKFNDLLDEEDRHALEMERLWDQQIDQMIDDIWR